MFPKINQQWYKLQFGRKQQQAFLEDLSSLMNDGVAVNQAIETIRDVSSGIMQRVAAHIANQIAQGKLLADGMQGWFKRPLVEIIRTGENSGTLTTTLTAATRSFSQQSSAITALINALLYPLTVVLLALGVSVFIKNSVLISFAKIKPVAQWPSVGQTLFYIGEITQTWWWLVLLLIIVIFILIAKLMRDFTGDLRHRIDNLPLLSLYRDSVAARFMETLGLLITNGVVFKKALNIIQMEASPYLAWHLVMMEYRLSGGTDNIADVLDTRLIRPTDLMRLRVVAKGKGFEYALINLGRQANEKNSKTIALTGKIFGVLFLLLAALIAMTLIFGIYTIGSSLTH
jgi:type II secretory pathway component PulF